MQIDPAWIPIIGTLGGVLFGGLISGCVTYLLQSQRITHERLENELNRSHEVCKAESDREYKIKRDAYDYLGKLSGEVGNTATLILLDLEKNKIMEGLPEASTAIKVVREYTDHVKFAFDLYVPEHSDLAMELWKSSHEYLTSVSRGDENIGLLKDTARMINELQSILIRNLSGKLPASIKTEFKSKSLSQNTDT